MRAKEFILENTSSMQDDVASALPMTFVIPKLQNQDPYKQYRFGVSIARAKGDPYIKQKYASETPWGENQIIVGFGNTVDDYIDAALKDIGLSPKDKKMITTPQSKETTTINISSPVAKVKRNRYGI